MPQKQIFHIFLLLAALTFAPKSAAVGSVKVRGIRFKSRFKFSESFLLIMVLAFLCDWLK